MAISKEAPLVISDTAIASIIAGIAPSLVALAALIQSIRNGKKANEAAGKAVTAVEVAKAAVVRADAVAKDTTAIKEGVDGNLSAVKQELAVAIARIEEMQGAKVLAKETSDDAVAAALAATPPSAPDDAK